MADDPYLYHPGVLYWDLPSGFGGKLDPVPPRLVVMHKTDNPKASARGEAKYASTRPPDDLSISSAHFYVDGIEIIGSVPLNYRAWSAHHFGNSNGWHIESCGMSGTFMTPADQKCVGLVRELCAAWKIPVTYVDANEIKAGAHGITGHHEIVLATGVGDHTDPGWTTDEWEQFISQVGGDDMFEQADRDALGVIYNAIVAMRDGNLANQVPVYAGGMPVLSVQVDELHARPPVQPAPVDEEAIRKIVREELDKTKLTG